MITDPPPRSRSRRRPPGAGRRGGPVAGGARRPLLLDSDLRHRDDRHRDDRHRDGRHRDDSGGVWIATGVVLGILMYGFIVLMDVAGFTAVLPLVVLPPVVLGLMAANSLINGPRGGERKRRPTPAPLTAADLDRLDDDGGFGGLGGRGGPGGLGGLGGAGGADGERPPRR